MNLLKPLLLIALGAIGAARLVAASDTMEWDNLVKVIPLPTFSQLPVSSVHTIFKDHEGYIWYGTSNGLCRDDGYDIQVFRNDYRRHHPIQGITIWCINEDDAGNIWFGTDDGLYQVNKPLYTVLQLDSIRFEGVKVKGIFHTSDGNMWVHSYNTLSRYDQQGHYLGNYPLNEHNPDATTEMVELGGRLYLNVPEVGIYFYQSLSDAFLPLSDTPELPTVIDISPDKQKSGLWMIDKYQSIYHYQPAIGNRSEGIIDHYNLPLTDRDDDYQNIRQDPVYGLLWIRTNKQLQVYSAPQSQQEAPQLIWQSQQSLHRDLMLGEMLVTDDEVWSMAFDVPSSIFHLSPVTHRHDPLQCLARRIPYGPAIIALAEAGEGWLWIYQERVGLCLVNPQTEQLSLWKEQSELQHYALGGGTVIANSPSLGEIWVDHYTDNHLQAFRRVGAKMQCLADIDLSKYISSEKHCTTITEDQRGRLWVGTTGGLLAFDAQTQKLLYCNTRLGVIAASCLDSEGRIWVTSLSHGLLCFSGIDEEETLLADKGLQTLAIDTHATRVWLGNDQGELLCLDTSTGIVTNHTEECGLNGDRINNLRCDSLGHLWIGMNQRLVEYNPIHHSTRHFTTSTDALTRLLPNAVATLSDGRLVYGGIPGLLFVQPSSTLDQPADAVQVSFTHITINGQPRTLTEGANSNLVLQLQPGERDICISVSSLQHVMAPLTRYRYRIRELDDQWHITDIGKNKISYSMFAKGHYTMEVGGMDRNGNWAPNVTTLHIEQLPYWYESAWAYLSYVLLGILGITLAIWWAMRKTRKRNEELWADSEEMLLMRQYLQGERPTGGPETDGQEVEFLQLDRLFIEKAEQAVRQNYSREDFGVLEFAEAVNMSKSTLNRKLKALTNQTPLEYINDYKMKQALEMLKDPDATIAEVTLALGFQSRRYFSAVFKKAFNESPTQYQKRVTQK